MVKQLRMRRFYSDYFYWFTMQQYLYKLKQSFIVLKKSNSFSIHLQVTQALHQFIRKYCQCYCQVWEVFQFKKEIWIHSKDGMCSAATEHVCAYSKVWLAYQWTQRFHKKEQTFCGLKGLVLDDTPVSKGSWRAFCMQNCCRSAAAWETWWRQEKVT